MRYRVLQKSFINNSIVEEGEIVEYHGKPGSNLERVDEPTKKKAPAPVPAPKPEPEAEVEAPGAADDLV